METSRVVKMARKSVVVMLGTIAFAAPLEASADAKPTLSRQQAVQAAGDRLGSRVGRSGDVRSFGIEGCLRRGRSVFTCRGTLVRAGGSGTVECGFTYRIKKRGTKIKTTLTGKRCDAESGGPGSGGDEPGGNGDHPGFETVEPRNPNNPFQGGPGPKYCPGNKGAGNWDARFDIVGKTYAQAIPIAAEHGCRVRIARIDGEYQVVTMDLRFDRMNVEIEGPNQLITAIHSVG